VAGLVLHPAPHIHSSSACLPVLPAGPCTAPLPANSCPWAVAAEREAGFILLGSMCAAAAPGLLSGADKQQQVLELFSVALGPLAAEALTSAGAAGAP
jgi:hypothetical protein